MLARGDCHTGLPGMRVCLQAQSSTQGPTPTPPLMSSEILTRSGPRSLPLMESGTLPTQWPWGDSAYRVWRARRYVANVTVAAGQSCLLHTAAYLFFVPKLDYTLLQRPHSLEAESRPESFSPYPQVFHVCLFPSCLDHSPEDWQSPGLWRTL